MSILRQGSSCHFQSGMSLSKLQLAERVTRRQYSTHIQGADDHASGDKKEEHIFGVKPMRLSCPSLIRHRNRVIPSDRLFLEYARDSAAVLPWHVKRAGVTVARL